MQTEFPLTNPKSPDLRARLTAVYRYVRPGATVLDVGTDHAYLPIALVRDGVAENAVASDVREGPVARAKEHVAKYGLEEKIRVVLSDGLSGADRWNPTDILIAGMGGELIVKILSEAGEWIRNRRVRFVFQPMTHPELLRAYLFSTGFGIVGECIAEDDGGRLYQVFAAEFDGRVRERGKTPQDFCFLLIGEPGMGQDERLYAALLEKTRRIYRERVLARRNAERRPAEYDSEEAILSELDAMAAVYSE